MEDKEKAQQQLEAAEVQAHQMLKAAEVQAQQQVKAAEVQAQQQFVAFKEAVEAEVQLQSERFVRVWFRVRVRVRQGFTHTTHHTHTHTHTHQNKRIASGQRETPRSFGEGKVAVSGSGVGSTGCHGG